MSTELISELERRAARHAALADPIRLRIVDLLILGDLSPTEMLATLGISSNLLSHHLNVLDAEGMISRSRSEADRRRSYVHLLPSALESLVPHGILHAQRVVFVCTANSARSQLAAALWRRHSELPAASAGTHPADRIEPRAIDTARHNQIQLDDTKPRRLADIAMDGDFIVTVCDNAHEELGNHLGAHWSVADPVRGAREDAFDIAFNDLAQRVGELASRLTHA
jgi:protein-tyrosine-phosphatase/DNA-binding HxlR family transcriptional regulator